MPSGSSIESFREAQFSNVSSSKPSKLIAIFTGIECPLGVPAGISIDGSVDVSALLKASSNLALITSGSTIVNDSVVSKVGMEIFSSTLYESPVSLETAFSPK